MTISVVEAEFEYACSCAGKSCRSIFFEATERLDIRPNCPVLLSVPNKRDFFCLRELCFDRNYYLGPGGCLALVDVVRANQGTLRSLTLQGQGLNDDILVNYLLPAVTGQRRKGKTPETDANDDQKKTPLAIVQQGDAASPNTRGIAAVDTSKATPSTGSRRTNDGCQLEYLDIRGNRKVTSYCASVLFLTLSEFPSLRTVLAEGTSIAASIQRGFTAKAKDNSLLFARFFESTSLGRYAALKTLFVVVENETIETQVNIEELVSELEVPLLARELERRILERLSTTGGMDTGSRVVGRDSSTWSYDCDDAGGGKILHPAAAVAAAPSSNLERILPPRQSPDRGASSGASSSTVHQKGELVVSPSPSRQNRHLSVSVLSEAAVRHVTIHDLLAVAHPLFRSMDSVRGELEQSVRRKRNDAGGPGVDGEEKPATKGEEEEEGHVFLPLHFPPRPADLEDPEEDTIVANWLNLSRLLELVKKEDVTVNAQYEEEKEEEKPKNHCDGGGGDETSSDRSDEAEGRNPLCGSDEGKGSSSSPSPFHPRLRPIAKQLRWSDFVLSDEEWVSVIEIARCTCMSNNNNNKDVGTPEGRGEDTNGEQPQNDDEWIDELPAAFRGWRGNSGGQARKERKKQFSPRNTARLLEHFLLAAGPVGGGRGGGRGHTDELLPEVLLGDPSLLEVLETPTLNINPNCYLQRYLLRSPSYVGTTATSLSHLAPNVPISFPEWLLVLHEAYDLVTFDACNL